MRADAQKWCPHVSREHGDGDTWLALFIGRVVQITAYRYNNTVASIHRTRCRWRNHLVVVGDGVMLHAHLNLKVKDLEHLTSVGLSCSTAQINIRETSVVRQKGGQNTQKQHAETTYKTCSTMRTGTRGQRNNGTSMCAMCRARNAPFRAMISVIGLRMAESALIPWVSGGLGLARSTIEIFTCLEPAASWRTQTCLSDSMVSEFHVMKL